MALLATLFSIPFTSCDKDLEEESDGYYILQLNSDNPGLTYLETDPYLQTTDYTCGPSAVVTLLRYYGKTGNELQIAKEMGTSEEWGSTPEQMATWLDNNGFMASAKEEGTLEMLQENLAKRIPTLVEWSDWGGHWVLVIGYDTRETESISDDVIIFADPYDYADDSVDGISWFNAERFYYMWYDALLFDRVYHQVYIDAIPE